MKQKLMNFMRGRYGVDQLNKHLLYMSMGLLLVGLIFRQPWLQGLWIGITIYIYFRMLSKNYGKRYQENQAYLKFLVRIKRFFRELKEKKSYKHFTCEKCKTRLRVPRGKGNLTITCPKCKNRFDAKT